jgi:ERCC4-related helicase
MWKKKKITTNLQVHLPPRMEKVLTLMGDIMQEIINEVKEGGVCHGISFHQ